jgi:hypothetical protein
MMRQIGEAGGELQKFWLVYKMDKPAKNLSI